MTERVNQPGVPEKMSINKGGFWRDEQGDGHTLVSVSVFDTNGKGVATSVELLASSGNREFSLIILDNEGVPMSKDITDKTNDGTTRYRRKIISVPCEGTSFEVIIRTPRVFSMDFRVAEFDIIKRDVGLYGADPDKERS